MSDAEERSDGKVSKWLKCFLCKEKTSFCPEAPKYHRLLIELIAKGRKREAEQVNNAPVQQATAPATHFYQATAHPALVYQAMVPTAPVYQATAPLHQTSAQPQQTAIVYQSYPPHPHGGQPYFRQP